MFSLTKTDPGQCCGERSSDDSYFVFNLYDLSDGRNDWRRRRARRSNVQTYVTFQNLMNNIFLLSKFNIPLRNLNFLRLFLCFKCFLMLKVNVTVLYAFLKSMRKIISTIWVVIPKYHTPLYYCWNVWRKENKLQWLTMQVPLEVTCNTLIYKWWHQWAQPRNHHLAAPGRFFIVLWTLWGMQLRLSLGLQLRQWKKHTLGCLERC